MAESPSTATYLAQPLLDSIKEWSGDAVTQEALEGVVFAMAMDPKISAQLLEMVEERIGDTSRAMQE